VAKWQIAKMAVWQTASPPTRSKRRHVGRGGNRARYALGHGRLADAKSTSARDPARMEHKNIQHAVRYTEVAPDRLKDLAVEITITRR